MQLRTKRQSLSPYIAATTLVQTVEQGAEAVVEGKFAVAAVAAVAGHIADMVGRWSEMGPEPIQQAEVHKPQKD